MKKAVCFVTSNGNSYLYSPFKNQVLLCHPLISHLFELDASGIDLKQHISAYKNNLVYKLQEFGVFPYKELVYQLSKYRFLKKNNFFKVPGNVNLNGRLRPSRIAQNISRIQQVIFETTEDCNLSCTYCTFSKFYINKDRGKRKFNPTDARKALDHLISLRDPDAKQFIISFYGGEPLKNIKFIRDIVDYVSTRYGDRFEFKFTMSSNGLLLSKYADYLSSHNFEVSVSLDGDETGNSFRVLPNNRSSYDLVIKNLDFVREHYPSYFDKCITFLTVLHNKNSFSAVHSFFKEKYGKTTSSSLISTLNLNEEYKAEFQKTFLDGSYSNDQEQSVMQELFLNHPGVKELATVLEKYSGFIFKNHFQIITKTNNSGGTKEFVPTATCSPFSMRVFLTADGCIVPCEHISRVFEIGQLKNNEIHISNDSIAGMFNQCFDKIRPLCNRCFLADNCKECIFNTRIETENPVCDYFMDENKFKQYLAKNFDLIEKDFPLYRRVVKDAFNE